MVEMFITTKWWKCSSRQKGLTVHQGKIVSSTHHGKMVSMPTMAKYQCTLRQMGLIAYQGNEVSMSIKATGYQCP